MPLLRALAAGSAASAEWSAPQDADAAAALHVGQLRQRGLVAQRHPLLALLCMRGLALLRARRLSTRAALHL